MIIQNLERPVRLFDGVVLDQDRYSPPFYLRDWKGLSLQFKWDGAPVGAFRLEVCVEEVLGWVALPEMTKSFNGTAGMDLFEFGNITAPLLRLVYTWTSGTGTLIASIYAKAL